MARQKGKVLVRRVERLIHTIRGRKIVLDADLAELYGVRTSALNQAVKRNIERFPEDFAFRLDSQEFMILMSQIVTSNGRGGRRKLPFVFTEHGAIMAANVLNSPKAVEMSVFVVRAFVKMREQLVSTATLEKRLAEIEKVLLTHDSALRDLYMKIRPILLPPPEPKRRPIGFEVREKRASYRTHKKSRK